MARAASAAVMAPVSTIGVEHEVAALHGALGVTVGIAVAGALEHAGEEGAFGEVELLEVFAEEGLCGFAEAVDVVAAAVAEVDLVGVHLEDLLLVEARFELEGDHDFGELALEVLVRREEEAARSCMVSVEPPQRLRPKQRCR